MRCCLRRVKGRKTGVVSCHAAFDYGQKKGKAGKTVSKSYTSSLETDDEEEAGFKLQAIRETLWKLERGKITMPAGANQARG